MGKRKIQGCLAVLLILSGVAPGWADSLWQAASPDDWFDASAWSGGVPSSASTADINSGTANITYGNAAANFLNLGDSPQTNAIVNISAGELVASTINVGESSSSSGTLSESGGIVSAQTLNVANGSTFTGTYNLSGNGALFTTEGENIGSFFTNASAQFVQTGGINNTIIFTDFGSYIMSGQSSFYAAQLNIDGLKANQPSFTQIGGEVFIQGQIELGTASYSISAGGTLNANGSVYIGKNLNETASFTQTDSNVTLGIVSTSSFALYMGYGVGSTASYTLAGNSQLNTDSEFVGYGSNSSATFTQTGGINNLNGSLSLAFGGGSSGSYTMSGNSVLNAQTENIGYVGTGTFTQSGGTNNAGGLFMGNNSAGQASYTLNSGALNAYIESFGTNNSAIFNQNGGTNTVFVNNNNGELNIYEATTYNLSGGELNVPEENVGLSDQLATSLFNQTGGVHLIGTLNISEDGKFVIQGGDLQITNQFSNTGIFDVASPPGAGTGGKNIVSIPVIISGNGATIAEANAFLGVKGFSQASLNISGEIQLLPNSAGSTLNSLLINPGGTLDITNDPLSIAYTGASPLTTIQQYVASGFASGWTSNGIVSSLAAGQDALGVGFVDTGTAISLRYTWLGDANLDGKVNSTDMALMSASGTTWGQGDFNYDGVVNSDDYALFELGLAESGGNSVPVPEPGLLIAPAFVLVCIRRRREFSVDGGTGEI